jgi:CRISPR/Cas system-associated exonuclease Cas4 (RecB family)
MLKTFAQCPRKYYLQYVEKISVPQRTSFFEKGKKIHALAHYYLRGDNTSKLEQSLNADERQVWQVLLSNEYFNKTYVASEYNLSCKIGGYWIGGRLDALMRDDSGFYILDYKTGAIPKNPENDYQTMIYLLAVKKYYETLNSQLSTLNFIYIGLKENKSSVIDFNPAHEDAIIEICDKITNEKTFAQSNNCKWCEFKKICGN